MRNKLKSSKGFTLIELIVVVAILGILVLLAGPKMLGYGEKAEIARIQHDLRLMEQEIELTLLEKEDEFIRWDNNKKNLGTLVMQNKLFDKEGPSERIDTSHLLKNSVLNIAQMDIEFDDNQLGMGGDLIPLEEVPTFTSIDETYKIVPEEYKDTIGTILDGTFYTNELGKVYYEHDKPIKRDDESKILNCPLPLSDYDFEPETGTIAKWYGTVTHLIIPEAFLAKIDGKEQCVPVRIIGKAAFMQGGFESIVIPQSVVRIEENSFKDNLLTKIYIPHSVKYIGENAFSGNNFGGSGGVITIKNNSSSIIVTPGAFGGPNPTYSPITPQDLNVVFHPSSGKIVSMGVGGGKSITIPESFNVGGVEYPVKQIAKGAYQGLDLISVILPSELERIEDYAFAGNQLEGITIPSKVNHIGNYAFAFNEAEHTITGHRKATMKFINIKNEEQFHKINQYGDIYENGVKVNKLKNEVKLLNHIFVTSIGNHVVDEEYELIPPEPVKEIYYVNIDKSAFDGDINTSTLAGIEYNHMGESKNGIVKWEDLDYKEITITTSKPSTRNNSLYVQFINSKEEVISDSINIHPYNHNGRIVKKLTIPDNAIGIEFTAGHNKFSNAANINEIQFE